MATEIPGTMEYIGYMGSDPYPIFVDINLIRNGAVLTGSFYTKVGIFAGSSPLTGSYSSGECAIVWRKNTYRRPCDRDEFSGVIYDKKGKAGDRFRFVSLAAAERSRNSRSTAPAMTSPEIPTMARSVWALGRVRILTERGNRCGPEASLGKPFCFDRAIQWLQRRPNKPAIDVIAMDTSYLPGSMVLYNSGQGWSIYRVARHGTEYSADAQRHFGTKVQVPMGCRYQGVLQNAWYITIASGRKVAIEATQYNCGAWQGPWLYDRNADYVEADTDVARLDFTGTAPEYRDTQQSQSNQGAGSVPFGFPPQRTRRDYGTSMCIYDPPVAAPTRRKKR